MIFLKIIFIAVFLSFPILLWGYGRIYLSDNIWNRNRFISGMIAGAITVPLILFFSTSPLFRSELGKILSFFGIFIILGAITWGITKSGSPYISGFLRRSILLHTLIFFGTILSLIIIESFTILPHTFLVFLSSIAGFFFLASIEEGVKHISTIGLTAKEYRFSRRDFLIFTFFVTLGFSTLENAIYLIPQLKNGLGSILFVGITRNIFSLTIHVFAAFICVMMWWKALSYTFLSWRYILFFLFGYIGASSIHGSYNILVERGYIIPVIVLTAVGYFALSQWISEEKNS